MRVERGLALAMALFLISCGESGSSTGNNGGNGNNPGNGNNGGNPTPEASDAPSPTPGQTPEASAPATPRPSPTGPVNCPEPPVCDSLWVPECSGDGSQQRLCGLDAGGCPGWGAWKNCGTGRSCGVAGCDGGCTGDADLLLVVDRSAAVTAEWSAAVRTAVERLFIETRGAVRLALRVAPGGADCTPSPVVGAADTVAPLLEALTGPSTAPGPPVFEALADATRVLGVPEAEEVIVLLLAAPPACAGVDATVGAVTRLRGDGVRVELVTLGGGPGAADLERIAAAAGSVPRRPASPADLGDALVEIAAQMPLCCVDGDGDQHGPYCDAGLDCDDGDAAINASAVEQCNGKDDDCDGATDEDAVGPCGPCCPLGQRCVSSVAQPYCAFDCCSTADCQLGQVCGLLRAADVEMPAARESLCIETNPGSGGLVGELCFGDDNACQSSLCVGNICREACCADEDCPAEFVCADIENMNHAMFGTGLKYCK